MRPSILKYSTGGKARWLSKSKVGNTNLRNMACMRAHVVRLKRRTVG